MKFPLKVIHFCGSLTGGGGAGVACERLNSALLKKGIDNCIFGGQLRNIQNIKESFKKQIWLKLFQPAFQHTTTLGIRSHGNIVEQINQSECDILHLHIPNNSIVQSGFKGLRLFPQHGETGVLSLFDRFPDLQRVGDGGFVPPRHSCEGFDGRSLKLGRTFPVIALAVFLISALVSQIYHAGN